MYKSDLRIYSSSCLIPTRMWEIYCPHFLRREEQYCTQASIASLGCISSRFLDLHSRRSSLEYASKDWNTQLEGHIDNLEIDSRLQNDTNSPTKSRYFLVSFQDTL